MRKTIVHSAKLPYSNGKQKTVKEVVLQHPSNEPFARVRVIYDGSNFSLAVEVSHGYLDVSLNGQTKTVSA